MDTRNVGGALCASSEKLVAKAKWLLPLLLLAAASCTDQAKTAKTEADPGSTGEVSQDVTGNINPGVIEIDTIANLTAGDPDTALLNAPADLDWIVDGNDNTGTSCLSSDGIATCNQAGVTAATNGAGHWNGVRIVDGLNSGDQNIFLTGGKENDTSTWNIGPGSVGSSKYDISQAYLANNQTTLFFGMERSGNNGTTAFDFEFNQVAPQSRTDCVQNAQVPCRSIGDVLFTFEMQGAGTSGSATPHVFTWNGSLYVEGQPTGIVSSINNSTTVAGGPWGHVDSHGNWVLGTLDRFTFAEAAAPISLLPGVNACGGSAYVQVRTRSSSTASSDLKDTTKVFQFLFNSVSGSASLSPTCESKFHYTATGKNADGTTMTNPSCAWTFKNSAGTVVGTSSVCESDFAAAPGTYTASVVISDPNNTACSATVSAGSVTVLGPITVYLTPSSAGATCPDITTDAVTYTATVAGGNGNYSYTWNGQTCSGSTCTIDPSDSTFCASESVSVTVQDDSGSCSAVTSETETYTKVTTVTASDN